MVYFRAGYSPDDYKSKAEWDARWAKLAPQSHACLFETLCWRLMFRLAQPLEDLHAQDEPVAIRP